MSITTNWTTATIPASFTFICSNSTGQNLIGLTSVNGRIYYSVDYGSSWTQSNSPSQNWVSACSISGGRFAAVSSSSKVNISSTDFATWIQQNETPNTQYYSIASNEESGYIYALYNTGTAVGIAMYNNSTLSWSTSIYINVSSTGGAICTDSTGTYVAVALVSRGIWISTNYGNSFTHKGYNAFNWRGICSSYSGKYLAACGDPSYIHTSSDYGGTWNTTRASQKNWNSICCDSTGQYLHAVANNFGIYASYDYGETWSSSYSNITSGRSICSNSSGLRLAAVANTTTLYLGSLNIQYPCFKEDSLILTNKGYRRIQELRKGDLVKTLLNGFLKIDMIGKKSIYHKACIKDRIKDQLYKCSHENFKEVFEPLVLTGCHSILVDDYVSEEQRKKTIEINKDTYVTDRKYRLPACVDERTTVYEIPGIYTIYHLALENPDYYMNYGIYANGLLVETSSRRYLKELSGMELIE